MKKHLSLKGVFPIVATPFTPEGEVDFDSFENLITVLARGGCDALTLFGIAGEFYKLTDAEKQTMAEVLVARCRALGVPSIVSVTDHATEVAVKSARRFADLGADCLMVLPPYFLKPGAAAVEAHLRAIASAVPETPLMLQYAPEQTGVAIPPAVFATLARDFGNARDFKIECKPVGPYLSKLLEMTEGLDLRGHVGNAGYNMLEAYDRGAVGVMPGCSMFDLYLKIHQAHIGGDRQTSLRLHTALLALLNQIRQDVEMIIAFEKIILHRRGIIASATCRRPTHSPDRYAMALFETLYTEIEPLLEPLA
ncbi:MAG: dihydrodipicolinate synthase family protein [Kiritimatiellia bacterium]